MRAPAPRRRTSVRLRLSLAHAALLGALSLALAATGIWYVDRTLRAQVDDELAETTRLIGDAIAAADARTPPGQAHGEAVRSLRAGHLDVLLFDPTAQRVVSRTAPAAGALDSTWWPMLLSSALANGARLDLAHFSVGDPSGAERRVTAVPVRAAGRELVLVAVRDLRDVRVVVARLWRALAVVLPLALLASLAFGYLLARRGLAPIQAMSAQAERIGAATPGSRLVPRDPDDELGRMAAAFNALLDRLGTALEQQRHFMADASHELRTPAAVVRSAADVALRRDDRDAAEYRQALEIARAEADRLTRIVDDLFLLARADAGQPTLRAAEFYLDEALDECARAMRAVAEAHGIALRAELRPSRVGRAAGDGADADDAGAPMHGDESLVRRMVLNLIDNAIKYTPRGGSVTLRLAADALAVRGSARVRPAWRIEVEDTGAGVPADARPRIFDRFFHSDAHLAAHATHAGRAGSGLGLAMAQTIAEAHGGRLELSRTGADGSLFVAVLPRDGEEV